MPREIDGRYSKNPRYLQNRPDLVRPFDRYVGGDHSALNEQQVRGYRTFREVGCIGHERVRWFTGKRTALDSARARLETLNLTPSCKTFAPL